MPALSVLFVGPEVQGVGNVSRVSSLGGWVRDAGRGGSLGKKLISFEYFEFEVPLKHPNNMRSSGERSELKMDFGVVSMRIIVKAEDEDGSVQGEHGLPKIQVAQIES